jgi:hypothetical protein
MRLPWKKSSTDQLDLLDAKLDAPARAAVASADRRASISALEQEHRATPATGAPVEARGLPLLDGA